MQKSIDVLNEKGVIVELSTTASVENAPSDGEKAYEGKTGHYEA